MFQPNNFPTHRFIEVLSAVSFNRTIPPPIAVLKSFQQSVSTEQFPHPSLYWSPFSSLFQPNNSPTHRCIEVLSAVCFKRTIPPPITLLKSFQQCVSTEQFPQPSLYWNPFNSLFQPNNCPAYRCIEVLSAICFNRTIPPPIAVLKSFQQSVSTEQFPHPSLYWSPFSNVFQPNNFPTHRCIEVLSAMCVQPNNSPTHRCIEVLSAVCFNRTIPPPITVLKSFQQCVSTEQSPHPPLYWSPFNSLFQPNIPPPLSWLHIIPCWHKNTQGRWVQSLRGGTKECSRIGRLTRPSLPQSLVTRSQGSVTGEMNRPVFVCRSVVAAMMTTTMMVMLYETMAPTLCMKRYSGVCKYAIRNQF